VEQQVVLQDLAVRHAGLKGGREVRAAVQLREGCQNVLRVGMGHQQAWDMPPRVVQFTEGAQSMEGGRGGGSSNCDCGTGLG